MGSEPPARTAREVMARTWHTASAYALRAFLKLAPAERHRLFALTIVIGGVCGLAAVAFHSAIHGAELLMIDPALSAPGHSWIFWTIATPTLGALASGVLLHYVPQARGSGIPQVKLIYAVKSGRLRLRDAGGKFLIAILQIGSGSALGREGPTVQICAGLASALGRLFAIAPHNMRRLIPVGSAAGIAAAFNAPIAAVTFTIEEIIGDLDQTLLSGVVVAAALAAVIERSVLGEHPVFDVPGGYGLDHASSLLIYAAIGVAGAAMSHVYYEGMLGIRGWFARWKWPGAWARPGLGGLATGLLAVLAIGVFGTRGVTGDGYATLGQALTGNLTLKIMLVLAVTKLAATVLCYASGGSGGIFAPVLFIGGMIGGSFGLLDRALLSHPDTNIGGFALVGMGAFFAAVIRAPITSVLIIFEMTGGYGLVLPLMIANSVAYVLARRWQPVPIYEALLEQDGYHLPQTQRAASTLSSFHVREAMTTELVTLPAELSIGQAVEHIKDHKFSIYPVVDRSRQLLGLVSEARLRRCMAEGHGEEPVRTQAREEEPLRADQALVDAVARMGQLGARQMAVTAPGGGATLVGILAMSDVMRAHARAALGEDPSEQHFDSLAPRPAVVWARRDSAVTGGMPAKGRPPQR